MSEKYTPGPWVAAKGLHSYDVADQDGRLLARLWGDRGNYPISQFANTSYLAHDEHVANAHLIATAPELYAELFLARDEVAETRRCIFESSTIRDDPATLDEEVKPDIARLDAQLARIDAALAKATGQAAQPEGERS